MDKEIESWVRKATELGYDWETIEKELKVKEINEEERKKYEKAFLKIASFGKEIELGFWAKRKLKRSLRGLKKGFEFYEKKIGKIKEITQKEDIETTEEILFIKEGMIKSIIGDKEKKIEGLIEIFDSEDKETGKPIIIDKKMLREMDTESVIILYKDLLDELEKNI